MKINLGSGYKRYDDFVNVDNDAETNPDFLVDLENEKLPFEDNSVDEIKAYHILEHIGDGFFHLMQEIYRVCNHGAIIDIIVPHHLHEAYFGDPTHKRPITVNTFYLFSKKHNLKSIEENLSNSCLALKYKINFDVIWYDYKFDEFYLPYLENVSKKQSVNQLSDEEQFAHVRLMREAVNVAKEVAIKLVVIKDDE